MAIFTTSDSYTKLLIHSDDPDGSSFIDSSPSRHTVTRGGDAYHKATKKKFGSSSMEFDGSDDKLTIADHSDFDFGTGDFTIDFWFNTTVANQQYTSFVAAEPNNGITILLNTGSASDGKIGLWGAVGNPITSVGGWNDGVWHHCAAVRNGGDLDIYVDGISYVTVTPSAAQNHQNPWIIGDSYYGSRVYTGYIDEFRISTIARWTSNFTPPNKPYDIINTDTQTSDSKEDSAFEVTGGGNAQFGSNIITRSDPSEASGDSLFSVHQKDGTSVLDLVASGRMTTLEGSSISHYDTAVSVANDTWTTFLSPGSNPGLYMVFGYISGYAGQSWAASCTLRVTGYQTMGIDTYQTAYFKFRAVTDDTHPFLEVWHSAGGTFTIQRRVLRIY